MVNLQLKMFIVMLSILSLEYSVATLNDVAVTNLVRLSQNESTVIPSLSEEALPIVHNVSDEATNDERATKTSPISSKIRHLHQKVRLTNASPESQLSTGRFVTEIWSPNPSNDVDRSEEAVYADDASYPEQKETSITSATSQKSSTRSTFTSSNVTAKTYRLLASGPRKVSLLAAVGNSGRSLSLAKPKGNSVQSEMGDNAGRQPAETSKTEADTLLMAVSTNAYHERQINQIMSTVASSGAPNLENRFQAMLNFADIPSTELEGRKDEEADSSDNYDSSNFNWPNDPENDGDSNKEVQPNLDIVTKFLRIVESQHLLGENCTPGTGFNLGEGVVDRYAQERFRLEADVAVNRANWLTRLWKYADKSVLESEYLLHANLYSMIEMDEDIFAAGNCYDKQQYKDYVLFCPFAYRLPEGPILAKDLAVDYKYLSNTSEFFYIARKNAERVIRNMTTLIKAYHTYTHNETAHTERFEDDILSVSYEDGKWSKPYFDCKGGNIWMMTYTIPFFGYANGTYFFKGTSGIDIDLQRVDIDQCPQRPGSTQMNIFAASDKCKKRTTKCVHNPGLGFRRGSYRCECKEGYYFPDKDSPVHYYNGTLIEEEYEKKLMGLSSAYDEEGRYECRPCAEGCNSCKDDRPCVVTLNWAMRTSILTLEVIVICCLPAVAIFTWRYGHIKVVRAASPALLRLIIVGAFFIYCTTLVAYPRPSVVTCTLRIWFREIGFSFAYGALMLKTWRISVIFRVRSAKAVKITDLDLIKRLGVIVAIFTVFLSIRTMVDRPQVIEATGADDLKAFICQTDWWDHVFTAMEMVLLVWGIRLCIVVRKAPSEFNESRFISMAIYNEFLLSIFLNVSMLFLQSPANPDLMYIIMFSHTQFTTTLLLVLIFGSKAYLVLRGRGRGDDLLAIPKPQAAKFLSKAKSTNSYITPSIASNRLDIPGLATITDTELQAEVQRVFTELDQLREKTMRTGNKPFATRIAAMLQTGRQPILAESTCTDSCASNSNRLENGPPNGKPCDSHLRQRKSQSKINKNKSPKHSPDSGLGGLMFGSSGPHVNNVLACMTDKIVCATFSADPNLVNETEEDEPRLGEDCCVSLNGSAEDKDYHKKAAAAAPVSSLALAAAPLLSPSFSLNRRAAALLGAVSAPSSRRNSYQPDVSTPMSVQLTFVGDYTHSACKLTSAFQLENENPTGDRIPVATSVKTVPIQTDPSSLPSETCDSHPHSTSVDIGDECSPLDRDSQWPNHWRHRDPVMECPAQWPMDEKHPRPVGRNHSDSNRWSYPLSPEVVHKVGHSLVDHSRNSVSSETLVMKSEGQVLIEVDCTVQSAKATPDHTPRRSRSLKSRINTEDRERFTEEVTV